MDSTQGPSKWLYPDSERLWKLAHKIEERQLWAGYLSEQEHLVWRKALRDREKWVTFLEGRGEPLEMSDGQDATGSTDSAIRVSSEKDVDPVTTAFRVRAMLSEATVRTLFPSSSVDDFLDFHLDDDIDNMDKVARDGQQERPQARNIDEENYDDDDEEDNQPQNADRHGLSRDGFLSSDNISSALYSIQLTPGESAQAQIKSFPIDTYYHTFEHDRIAMLELQTVEVRIFDHHSDVSRKRIVKITLKQLRPAPKVLFRMSILVLRISR